MRIVNRIKQYPLLFTAFLLSVILKFFHINYQSAWLDELHSLNEANPIFSFSQVYHNVLTSEQMPPLYFYLLNGLFKIFGFSVIVGRVFSAILSIVSIYAIYKLGKNLYSKQAGQITALVLSVNYFHVFFSQEMRPYAFLELFTILSFYRLIIFLRKPKLLNAILYGVFSALMIYGHFFGLFVIISQCSLLLLFLLLQEKGNKKDFFINAFISGIIMLLLLIPAVEPFLKAMKIKEFWVPAPKPDILYLIFRDFFGRSLELLIFVVIIAVVFFRKAYSAFKVSLSYKALLENRLAFSFIILSVWLGVTVVVPLIKSYLSASVMLSRYFMVVVPALLLVFVIGLLQLDKKKRKYILIVFVCYSLLNNIVIKKYYTKKHKSQFREATAVIIQNNKDNTPVITSLKWHLAYFLENDSVKYNVTNIELEKYVNEMINDTVKMKSFWYIDGHNRPYTVSPPVQQFLDKKFYVKESYNGHDAWVKHYIILENTVKK